MHRLKTHAGEMLDASDAVPAVRGVVTHIQRFSLHDGPGIRTTVFFKGCQMRCPWCHNPETYRGKPEIQTFPDRCIACGACLEQCSHKARAVVDGGRVFSRGRCKACGRCAAACFANAIVLVGETKTAEEVVEEVLADRAFYASSGGGVTLSGGEPLMQPEFAKAILQQCRREGIHTAVETNLARPWRRVTPLAPLVDLWLVDLKLLDDAGHQTWTGVSNRHTLENIRRLDRRGTPIVVRTPVVGGVNDRPDVIAAIADWLALLSNVQCYELLPYHPLGTGKREALGLAAPEQPFTTPSRQRLEELAAAARRPAFEVKVAGLASSRPSRHRDGS